MLDAGEISKEEYDSWRYHYPEFDKNQHWEKAPSEALSKYADKCISLLQRLE